MIVSDHFQFIFVHVPKSGGTSCAAALRGCLPSRERRHWAAYCRKKHETLAELRQRLGRRAPDGPWVYDEAFSRHWKFGFVRSPWERMVSLYHYLRQSRVRPEIDSVRDFPHFLEQVRNREPWMKRLHSLRPQTDFFFDEQGRPMADFIGRYENLDKDFGHACRHLGLTAVLPRHNPSKHDAYASYYTAKTADWVAEHFQRDISQFDYSFGQ